MKNNKINTKNNFKDRFGIFIRKNKKLLKIIFVGIFLIIVGFCLNLLIENTNLFKIHDIDVISLNNSEFKYIDSKNIEEISMQYILENDKNFFSLNPNELKNQVKNKSSYAREIFIEKIFPGGIVVQISEKKPLILYIENTKCFLLDDKNTLIKSFKNKKNNCEDEYLSQDIVLINSTSEYDIYDENKNDLRFFDMIYQLIGLSRSLNNQIIKFEFYENIMILYDGSNRKYLFDQNSDIEIQLKNYVLVMNKIMTDKIEFRELDFRYERPVLRLK